MGALSRTKGAAGEREFARLIRDNVGVDVHRNWQGQAAQGGNDITGLAGYSIEVKRAKTYKNEWWAQAVEDTKKGELTVLAYRIDRMGHGMPDDQKWIIEMRACDVIEAVSSEHRVSMPACVWFEYLNRMW